MKTDFLFLAQTGFFALTFLCLVLVLIGVHVTYLRMGMVPAVATKKTFVVGALLVGWCVLVSGLALSGFLGNFSLAPLNMAPVIIPPLVTVLVLTFHPRTQAFIRHLPAQGVLALQAFRIPVEVFLWWLFLAGAWPERMTFEGYNWDIVSGLLGPVFAWLCYAGNRRHHGLAVLYHLVGLGLLANIVFTALLSLPTPFQRVFEEPGADIVVTFPVMFLPAFLVPLAYTLHVFGLRLASLEKKPSLPPTSVA